MRGVRRCAARGVAVCALAAVGYACTYGPPEERADVVQIVRLGDSYRALAVVRHDAFRRPTGLSAFPDGGKVRYLRRDAVEYLLDAGQRRSRTLAHQDAPDSLWESFDAHTVGLQDDSIAYVSLTGCLRDGECYPALQRRELRRLTTGGDEQVVDRVPDDAGLPGTMGARRPGEATYVRFGFAGNTITARFEEAGPATPLFLVRPDGSLEPVAAP